MAQCEVCGNDYHMSFEVITAGNRHVFDSFECAIHKLAPICEHCGCKVIGHGVEADGRFFCCSNCARQVGVAQATDSY
jgi:Rieske Fe-S protein